MIALSRLGVSQSAKRQALNGTYNSALVFLSIAVACFASYTALDLARRIGSLASARYRQVWLGGGAFALGIGIWSMHFIGMLAFSMPVPLGYDFLLTLLSLAIAIAVSLLVLQTVSGAQLSTWRLVISSIFMGAAIASMHYTGMAAMRMEPGIHYVPWIFIASILIAMVVSFAALWIAFNLRHDAQRYPALRQFAAAVVMGLAIAGMHYTGMAAAVFAPNSVCLSASGMSPQWVAAGVTGGALSILTITLLLSILDARMESATGKLAHSLQRANEKLMHQATHDALTDLPNRALLVDRVQHAIHAARRSDHPCALLFLDLDGFKTVNDSLGHAKGDLLLQSVARRLRSVLREEDMLARVGGDEFVILAEDLHRPDEVATICQKLIAAMDQHFDLTGISVRISVSVGVAVFPNDGETVHSLMANADAAMYEAKQGGKNAYRFFESSMNASALRTLQIQVALRDAIGSQQLSLHFQPKLSNDGRRLLGAEALLRWTHPELGSIPPAEFIPIAESAGLIMPIGQWVLEAACRQLCIWQEEGRPAIPIAINLSPQQFRQPDLAEYILSLISGYGLAPSALMLEITETVAMENAEKNTVILQKLQAMGFDVAIDDFGTGYSSLSYLRQFQAQQLKIDMTFIRGLEQDSGEGKAIVAAIIALGHALNMEVVAEGVETPAQFALLNQMGCDQVQGYLFGRPVRAEEFACHFEDVTPEIVHTLRLSSQS